MLVKVIPLPSDPIGALQGCGKGEALLERLLASRHEDHDREYG